MYFLEKTLSTIKKPVVHALSPFPSPTTYFGENASYRIPELAQLYQAKKVLFITCSSLVELGTLNPIFRQCQKQEIQFSIFDQVNAEPDFDLVQEILNFCVGCDCIVAIGGGSVIDAAKVVAAAHSNKKDPRDLIGLMRVRKRSIPLIAVPTTAGTGSETTVAAIITDSTKEKKCLIIDPKLIPEVAILDPTLTISLPNDITASTTLDALTHAIEAFVSTYATTFTNQHAEIAIQLIATHFPIVLQDPTNLKSREALLRASYHAGIAFTHAYVGYVHAFAHAIGAKYHIPHGQANGILLPHILRFYLPSSYQKIAHLARLIHIADETSSDGNAAMTFIDYLFSLNQLGHIPQKFSCLSEENMDEIIKAAFKECHLNYPVPAYLTEHQAKELLRKVI